MNSCIRSYTCFLGRPLNSSSNCSSSWAPRAPRTSSLFTQKAVEEVSQHSLIGSPCCRTIRAEPSFSCDDNNTSRILVGLPISCISLTTLHNDKIALNSLQNQIIIPIQQSQKPLIYCLFTVIHFFNLCQKIKTSSSSWKKRKSQNHNTSFSVIARITTRIC